MLKIRLPQIRSESQICVESEEEDKESSNSLQGQANGKLYVAFFKIDKNHGFEFLSGKTQDNN